MAAELADGLVNRRVFTGRYERRSRFASRRGAPSGQHRPVIPREGGRFAGSMPGVRMAVLPLRIDRVREPHAPRGLRDWEARLVLV